MLKFKHLKEKAIKLRYEGHTLPEISKMLNRSKTTVYYWIKDAPIKNEKWFKIKVEDQLKINLSKGNGGQLQQRNLRGQTLIQIKYENLHNVEIETAKVLWEDYKNNLEFRQFIMAYFCEGFKRTKHSIQISNSNPEFMLFSKKWFDILNYRGKPIELHLQYHTDQDKEALIAFWGELLHPAKINCFSKSNSGKLKGRNYNSKYGIASIRLFDAYLKTRIDTWIKLMFNDINRV